APAELVVGPVRAHGDTHSEEYPCGKRPRTHPARPGGVDATLDESSKREGKGDGEPDIAEIKQRRMNRETDILQDRIEVAAFEWSLRQPQERIGGDENEQIERASDPPV